MQPPPHTVPPCFEDPDRFGRPDQAEPRGSAEACRLPMVPCAEQAIRRPKEDSPTCGADPVSDGSSQTCA
jgi:hypothetical protein